MKKNIIIIIVSSLLFINAFAQRNEIGLLLGTTYYLGDLNPSRQFFLTQPAGGIVYRYNINPRWAIKIDGLYGSIAGDDSKAGYDAKRNLSFISPLLEMSSQLELNFLPYATGNKQRNYFTPYIFAGVAVFHFNPKAEYNGTWYALQPLGTEGQGTSEFPGRKPYALTTISFPFGIGFKYSVGKIVCIGAEWGMRKTTTDYLDDVSTTYPDPVILAAENGHISAMLSDRSIILNGESTNDTGLQRGNPATKDWYSFAGAFITVKIKNLKSKSCSAYKKQFRIKQRSRND